MARQYAAMKSYVLKNVSPQLWEKFKRRAEREGHTLRFLILRWIQQYAEGK